MVSLALAIRYGNVEMLRVLLEHGVGRDFQAPGGKQLTPLHLAAENGGVTGLEMLLSTGLDVNRRDLRGGTPLFEAAAGGHLAATQFLHNSGADCNVVCFDERTALWWAANNCHDKVAVVLLERGADPKPIDEILAAKAQLIPNTFNMLLDREFYEGDNVNWALVLAACTGGEELARLLLQRGKTEIDFVSDETARTLLSLAAVNGQVELVKLQLEEWCVARLPRWRWSNAAVAECWAYGEKRTDKASGWAGADINSRDITERTPLWYAAHTSQQIYEYLLEKGNDASIEDETGTTPASRLRILKPDSDDNPFGEWNFEREWETPDEFEFGDDW